MLIIDDELAMGHILVKSLTADGFNAVAYTLPSEAVQAIPGFQPDLILTDVRMPGMTGGQLLHHVRSEYPEIPVLVMTAYGTVEDAVDMLKSGAYSYITKPFQHANLVHQIQLALTSRRLELENVKLSEQSELRDHARAMIGHSPEIELVRAMIQRAAQTDSVVLVTGESGVGKELVAREIHRQSSRHNKRFVAVNCPAIPATLIESEMFGYERGAFTGADRPKMGLIELSVGGTLFLDEIGELPPEIQVKLLRVLQEREIQRLGGLRQIPVDLRIITATNRDLEKEVEANRFRLDLYYRLKVLTIEVPALRERPEDIPELVEMFIDRLAQRAGRRSVRIRPEVLRALEAYSWPGNIRELENIIERMVTMGSGEELGLEDLPADFVNNARKQAEVAVSSAIPIVWPNEFKEARDQFEKLYLRQILQESGGSMAKAARLSGISRRHLYQKIDKLGLNKDQNLSEKA